jgi:membrane-associated protein
MDFFSSENLIQIIKTIGYFGIFGIVFAESGLLIGFFLPGDSLLFTAGFLASQGVLQLPVLILIIAIAAITGDSVGYTFGHKIGRRIFHKKDSLFFHQDNLKKAEDFYEKHGAKTIILARFMPVLRAFAPILAGVGKMKYSTFLLYNIVGGILWTVSLTAGGYYLGKKIPDIDHYLLPILGGIVFLSVLPTLIHIFVKKGDRKLK